MFRCNHVCKKVIGYGNCEWVLRGQFISSNYKLADIWGWSESSVRLFIKLLIKEKMLSVLSSRHYTLYEVTNYCVYQSADISELEGNPNAQITHRKRTRNAPAAPNNNDNKYKELKELINTYSSDAKLNDTLIKFLDMRIAKKKTPTNYAMELIFKTLKPFDIETQVRMLEKSIVSQWTDVFPLKDESKSNKSDGNAPNKGNFTQRPIPSDEEIDKLYKDV